jgi:hypothetical protein
MGGMHFEGDMSGPELFSQFYAVVLPHAHSATRRVLWSPRYQDWLRSRDGRVQSRDTFLKRPGTTDGHPDEPDQEKLTAAEELAARVFDSDDPWVCERCGQRAPRLHFIAPDVHGVPAVYCVEVPALDVVESKGVVGLVKHWGSPFACQSVNPAIETGPADVEIGPRVLYPFGKPLPAGDVIARDWCSRCVQSAAAAVEVAARNGEPVEARMRVQAEIMIKNTALELLRYSSAQR